MFISNIAKKGGVGKSTLTSYLGHYMSKSTKVCIISMDDQNTTFTIFGERNLALQDDQRGIDYLVLNYGEYDDPVEETLKMPYEVRENLYLVKMFDIFEFDNKLIFKRINEKRFKKVLNTLYNEFDVILFDFPPVMGRTTEILLEVSDIVNLVVGMDEVSLDGLRNTLQFALNHDIDLGVIKNIIPNKHMKLRKSSIKAYERLQLEMKAYGINAKINEPIPEMATVRNLQTNGVSLFDDDLSSISRYDKEKVGIMREIIKDVAKQL